MGMITIFNVTLGLSSNKNIILLDEPMLGLDPIARQKLSELISISYQKNSKLILISTHLVNDLEKIAENIMIMAKGKNILSDSVENIEEKSYRLTGFTTDVPTEINNAKLLKSKIADGISVNDFYGKRPENLSKSVQIHNLNLEDFFIDTIENTKRNNSITKDIDYINKREGVENE
jgi:ABC-2 type transport system ATP-binding protein